MCFGFLYRDFLYIYRIGVVFLFAIIYERSFIHFIHSFSHPVHFIAFVKTVLKTLSLFCVAFFNISIERHYFKRIIAKFVTRHRQKVWLTRKQVKTLSPEVHLVDTTKKNIDAVNLLWFITPRSCENSILFCYFSHNFHDVIGSFRKTVTKRKSTRLWTIIESTAKKTPLIEQKECSCDWILLYKIVLCK